MGLPIILLDLLDLYFPLLAAFKKHCGESFDFGKFILMPGPFAAEMFIDKQIKNINSMMTIYTVTIVEDDREVRERLACLINEHSQFKLLSASVDVKNGLLDLVNYKPDILLVDLGLPDGSGIEVIKAVSLYQLNCTAMVISGFQDEHNVFKALEAGAQAYILKHDKSQKITDSILSMMDGGAPISPVIARLMLHKFQKPPQVVDFPESLTEKQKEILKLVSQGFTSKEIAEKLSISYYTVTTHVKNIYSKLQVNSRTEALYEANRLGLLGE